MLSPSAQQEGRRARDDHEGEQQEREQQVQLGQPAHALVEAGRGRHAREDHDHRDEPDAEQVAARVPPGDRMQARAQLHHAVAERRRDPGDRADQRERIDGVADPAVDALAQHRIQPRAQRQRQVVAEAEVREHEPHQPVDRPRMEAPVEEGHQHRLARGGRRAGVDRRRLQEVLHRLADAEVHQADAHAGREQHGRPRHEAEFGFGIVGAEPDIAEVAGGDQHEKHEEAGDGEHVEPVETCDDPLLAGGEQRTGFARVQCAYDE